MFLIDDSFKPYHRYQNDTPLPGDFLFVFDDKKIGLTLNNEIPTYNEQLTAEKFYCFGKINQHHCFLWPKEGLKLNFIDTRYSFQVLSNEFYQAAAYGNHLYHFRNNHLYCGKCASPMMDRMDEHSLICSSCSSIIFPIIAPCVIVLITRGDEILLARSPHFMPNVMSTLAGFVNIGESIEQTVIREVKEEVGLEIGNLKYICSQPWPFPDSLMLGFTAEYVSGDIVIDGIEIEKAGWFHKDNLPQLPNKMSIARYLIDKYLELLN
jgi:NAD+ diphosphatase